MDFRYYMPVKTFFGRDCVKKNSAEFKNFGSRALIVTGKHSAEKNGSLADVASALNTAGIPFTHFNRIEPNPTVENVREVSEAARGCGADFIIGIGGGSPLDAAKAAAILAANDITDDDLFNLNFKNMPLKIAAIPTTAGTGSEVTPYSILSYKKISNKRSVASDTLFPAVALLDPHYTVTLSREVTINTAVDALSHAVEGYLAARATDVIKPFAIESITLLGEALPVLVNAEADYETREKLLYASMLAGIVIAHTGTTAVHAMGYPLTYHKNIDHGRANALVMCSYLKFIAPSQKRVSHILAAMKLDSIDKLGALIDALLGEKETISDDEIELFTETAIQGKNIANTIPQPDRAALKNIFIDSFRRG